MYLGFSIASACFAAVAAVFWGWSALINLPVIGSTWQKADNLDGFYLAMKKVARLNAFAALSAFLAAACQAIAFYAP